ncbi:MAG: hypothetical protein R3C05_09560 [Pirellulaceae bacterium]
MTILLPTRSYSRMPIWIIPACLATPAGNPHLGEPRHQQDDAGWRPVCGQVRRFREIKPEAPITIGSFTVTGYSVDHSIYGCLAFLIEAEGRRILYTGVTFAAMVGNRAWAND